MCRKMRKRRKNSKNVEIKQQVTENYFYYYSYGYQNNFTLYVITKRLPACWLCEVTHLEIF